LVLITQSNTMVSKAFKLAGVAKSTSTDGIIEGDATPTLIKVYPTIDSLPLSGNTVGNVSYVDSDNKLYLFTGEGWYNIALINQSPNITSEYISSYYLSIDGTPTVITLTAVDPEDVPITWSYAVTSGTLGNTATVSQADNVFTITPSTDENNAGEFSITFTASDGINTDTSTSVFTLSFYPDPGQQEYTTPGTYSWTAPAKVRYVSVVCVGGGGAGQIFTSYSSGGGGGGLGWKNDIPVTPGNTYTVVVGAGGIKKSASNTTQAPSGEDSYFIDTSTVMGGGGEGGRYTGNNLINVARGGTYVGDGGGNGGDGGPPVGTSGTTAYAYGGGGAGGYSGDGGYGGMYNQAGQPGQGGGGGAGGGGGSADYAGGGGGVGIYGEGTSGTGGNGSTSNAFPGFGGSGGDNGNNGIANVPTTGGNYGGGGGGADGVLAEGGAGGSGAVRIIWGRDRAFPSTSTEDILP
jgi:hypothetical protein